ncbi:MAG: hypothetical protein ACI81P_001822 [Neolewinella sp.]
MKKIKELVGLLGKKHLPLGDTKSGEQARLLYLYARRVAEPTDDGGAKKLNLLKSSPAYRKVKHRLKYALLDGITAVSSDPRVPANRPEASLRCWSSIALAKSNHYAYDLLPRDLIDADIQLSHEYDLLEASSLLTDVLADRPSVGPDIVHYLERSDYLGELGVAMAELYDASFYIASLKNEHSSSREISSAAINAIEKIDSMEIERFDYVRLYYYRYIVIINKFIAQHKFVSVIEESNNALEMIKEKSKDKWHRYSIVFKIYKLQSYVQLENFKEGVGLAEDLLSQLNKDTINYAKTQELIVLLCLRTSNFQEAYMYFNKYNIVDFGGNMDSYFAETILIFKAYIGVLIITGDIKTDESKPLVKLKIGKFINSFEHAQKEKTFRNVQIVLIKLVFAAITYNGDKLYNEIDACKKYVNRHMNKENLDRSRWIIKAIIYSVERGMTTSSVEFVTRNYVNKLGEFPILETRQHSHIEVVRYDVLWSIILKHVGRNLG